MVLHKFDVMGIPGSQYVRRQLESIDSDDPDYEIPLYKGANQEIGEKQYWQYSSGVLGQYFVGVLLQLGLIDHQKEKPEIFVSTRGKGKELATYFEENLACSLDLANIRHIFHDQIYKGIITIKDLKELSDAFDISCIPDPSNEMTFYRKLLIEDDTPHDEARIYNKFRSDSIALCLNFLRKEASESRQFERQFPHSMYLKQINSPNILPESVFGWFYYQSNEFAHYAMETMLWSLLIILHTEQGPVHSSTIKEKMVTSLYEHVYKTYPALPQKALVSDLLKEVASVRADAQILADEIEINEENWQNALSKALKLLFVLFIQTSKIEQIEKYAIKFNMKRDGDVTDLLAFIQKNINTDLRCFLSDLILQKVIDRHILVAFRKLRTTGTNTLKFNINDNYMTLREFSAPVWTTPRLRILFQFFIDLHLITKNGQVLSAAELVKNG
jgi:hypothetical protein